LTFESHLRIQLTDQIGRQPTPMKTSVRFAVFSIFIALVFSTTAQTTYTLNPLTSFGSRGDGSIQPGDSIGSSPYTTYNVLVSAPGVTNAWFPGETVQDQRTGGSTNGFNMRGLGWDPVSGNLIFVDTHLGSGGSVGGNGALSPYAGIYVLDPNSGQIIGALKTNGISGGAYTHVAAGVSDDGVVYVANQANKGTTAFKIYRWPTANPNDANFNTAPVVAYSSTAPGFERVGLTLDARGAGTNTQILVGSADPAKTGAANAGNGTNVFLFTTIDGTNFTYHCLYVTGLANASFNDGVAFGPGNTFWTKEVGAPLNYIAFDPSGITNNVASTNACTLIANYPGSSPNDPLLNLSAIAVDPVRRLLAGLEQIGGTATGGRGKVWLFDIPDPTNHAPAVLASRTYIPNFQKTTAPMGYLRFTTNGGLYAHASNNGLLASTVDSLSLSPPTLTIDLPATTRIAEGQNAHFEVFAVTDVTNYQWFSNSVPIPGVHTYFYDIPNANTNMSGVFNVLAFNAAGSVGSANSTLTVVSASQFLLPVPLWSVVANNLGLNNPTNLITTIGVGTPASASGTPNERCIAYNALSNQLLVVRGPSAATDFPFLRIFVVDADSGTNGAVYYLNTNGMTLGQNLTLCGIGVADDGAVYAATAASDTSFKVYRWADTDSNTVPVTIFGTNSSAGIYNPLQDLLGGTTFRFGDNLAVRGSGNDTEIILDSQNSTKFASILRPVADGTMTNWTETGYLLQNIQGSYGSEAYGTTIGRSLQFGGGNTFWQKRYNGAAGAPLALMGYNPGGGVAPLMIANTSPGLFTNGTTAVNSSLNIAAAINFVGAVGTANGSVQDTLVYYDVTDPAQAVLLGAQPLPQSNSGGHQANGNAIGQVIFGANPHTGTNYIFVLDGNNGIAAFVMSGGASPPPRVIVQPRNLRVLQGSSGSMTVTIDQVATIAWYKGTNSPVDTGVRGNAFNINNATTGGAGDYFAVVTNVNGSATSQVAHVTVSSPADNYTLAPAWGAAAGNSSFPYITANGGANTPNERAFAYNALSNQLVVVRCPPASTAYNLWVVDATTGASLYSLNSNGIVHMGASEVSGSNPIDLVGAAAADDGAIYVCSESPNASGGSFADANKMFHIYRWANTAPTTTPVLVYEGDPSGQPAGLNLRWGDVLAARGSGTNTELFLNSFDGSYAAILKPGDATLNAFTNFWFVDSAGGGSIGRSVQFGTNNTVFEKRKGAPLVMSRYDTNTQTTAGLLSVDSSSTLGGVAVDLAHNLAIGVDFVGSTTAPLKPDAVSLYDITDPTTPMLINRYNYPANQVANANVLCQTIISGNKVFALDANNGLMAFTITPPANSAPMVLNIAPTGANVTLYWSNSTAILQSSPSLSSQSWTDLTTAGQTNSIEPASGSAQFYRLRR
jgi:hypothetical protein